MAKYNPRREGESEINYQKIIKMKESNIKIRTTNKYSEQDIYDISYRERETLKKKAKNNYYILVFLFQVFFIILSCFLFHFLLLIFIYILCFYLKFFFYKIFLFNPI